LIGVVVHPQEPTASANILIKGPVRAMLARAPTIPAPVP